jgi:hypothetical protein
MEIARAYAATGLQMTSCSGCFLAVCCLALSVEDAILLGLLQVAAYSLRRTSIGSTSEAR